MMTYDGCLIFIVVPTCSWRESSAAHHGFPIESLAIDEGVCHHVILACLRRKSGVLFRGRPTEAFGHDAWWISLTGHSCGGQEFGAYVMTGEGKRVVEMFGVGTNCSNRRKRAGEVMIQEGKMELRAKWKRGHFVNTIWRRIKGRSKRMEPWGHKKITWRFFVSISGGYLNLLVWGILTIELRTTSVQAQNYWHQTSLSGKAVSALVIGPSGRLFAAVSLDGIYVSTDNGDNWRKTSMTGAYGITSFAVNSLGDIITGTQGGGCMSPAIVE